MYVGVEERLICTWGWRRNAHALTFSHTPDRIPPHRLRSLRHIDTPATAYCTYHRCREPPKSVSLMTGPLLEPLALALMGSVLYDCESTRRSNCSHSFVKAQLQYAAPCGGPPRDALYAQH